MILILQRKICTPEQENENLQQNDEEIEGRVDGGAFVDFAPEIEGENPDGEVSGQTPYIVVPEQRTIRAN